MPENTSIIFFDEYKKLDKLCSEMHGKNSGGVTCYLNDMMVAPVMQRNRIPEWNQTYVRLRELRHIRNQMTHGEGSFEDYPCSEEDVLWLFEFRSKIMHISDPLAVYRRQTEESMHATRVKEDFQLAVDQWQTEESMHATRIKEDFPRAVDQSQTEENIADHQRIKMDNVEVIDQEESGSFEKEHGMLKEIAVFGLIVLIVAAAVLIFGNVYMKYFLLS